MQQYLNKLDHFFQIHITNYLDFPSSLFIFPEIMTTSLLRPVLSKAQKWSFYRGLHVAHTTFHQNNKLKLKIFIGMSALFIRITIKTLLNVYRVTHSWFPGKFSSYLVQVESTTIPITLKY